MAFKLSHSDFFELLESQGHELTIFSAGNASLDAKSVKEYGEYLFDNIIIMAPSIEECNFVDVDLLVDFVDSGNNLFVAGTNASFNFFFILIFTVRRNTC